MEQVRRESQGLNQQLINTLPTYKHSIKSDSTKGGDDNEDVKVNEHDEDHVSCRICLEDSLKREWNPARKLSHILEYIVLLLQKPNVDQPWRPQIAKL